ncbi:MAG: hypothetical protein KKE30_03370 [Gammaproteobacteria bacterium]|nr:hypothetical protein [Gammaproteobacteria bacterium]MBU2184357.1 hypothetical protein [Gammaproteobacteria bacterium]
MANINNNDVDGAQDQLRNSYNSNVLDRIDDKPTKEIVTAENGTTGPLPNDKESDSALEHKAIAGTENGEGDSSGNPIAESYQLKEKNIIVDDGQKVVLKTTALEKLNHDQVNNFIESLRFSGEKNYLSYETEVNLDNVVNNLLSNKQGVSSVPAGCATSLCGVLISSESLNDIRSLIDELSNKENLGQYVNGGFLRIYDDNGIYYGLVVAGLEKGKPITIAK